MTMRTKLLTLAGATLLTLAVVVAAVAAGGPAGTLAQQTTPGTGATPATGSSPVADFLAKLAANLGVSQDRLTAAVKQTDLQLIDEAEAAGRLTADQAQAARDRVNNSPADAPPLGIGGRHGGGGRGFAKDAALVDAAASYFGVSADQLRQDLMTAGSWQAVAAKYGKDNDAGKAGLRAALATALRQSLTAKGLDAAQVDQRVSQFEQNFDQFFTQPAGRRGPGGPPMPAPATPATSQ